ncbi:effector-associated constant component EACC1 [Actinacidiphila acidipaludis]|uniref:effector-associated constant component EACC1 n=1 Tax=Actinacidiphila acidipaludis TaxID=2873382 RepID=UPI0027E0C6B1|nr:hypothetical protein [Streptomyces acidipaludis]
MDVTLEVEGHRAADELRSLREWLLNEDGLRGRVRLVDGPVVPGTLGAGVEALAVALAPGGIATAVASVLIAWIRHRTSDVTLKVTRPDGTSYELTATDVPDFGTAAVADLAAQLSASAASTPAVAAGSPAAGEEDTAG